MFSGVNCRLINAEALCCSCRLYKSRAERETFKALLCTYPPAHVASCLWRRWVEEMRVLAHMFKRDLNMPINNESLEVTDVISTRHFVL